MVQYLTGGKWGLLVRRPLEAMTRTLPLVFLMFLPIGSSFMKKLYLWAQYPDSEGGFQAHLIDAMQAHAIAYKQPMLNPRASWIRSVDLLRSSGLSMHFLNRWSLQRDADPQPNVRFWQQDLRTSAASASWSIRSP